MLNILICTIEERREQFNQLLGKLEGQRKKTCLTEQVSILWECDNGSLTVGAKRNVLLARCSREFVCFVDDDDDVSPNYIKLITDVIKNNPAIDCIGIRGQMSQPGQPTRPFLHSLEYPKHEFKGGIYLRPPNHLNPVRRLHAQACGFPGKDFSEDAEYAERLRVSGRLKAEYRIPTVLYFYNFDPAKTVAQRKAR